MAARPRLSIGLPVYNGENFLEETLASLLSQTFGEFELVVSDNASTDRTEEICRDFAARDSRLHYHRNAENIGGAGNFNLVFELSSADYFKWSAHDDMCRPEFLARCVEALDSDSSAVGAYPRGVTTDEQGRRGAESRARPHLCSPLPHRRLREVLTPTAGAPGRLYFPIAIYGVIRSERLRRTRLFRSYPASDRSLLAELTLRGPFIEVPEPLFVMRDHRQSAGRTVGRNPRQAVAWWNPRSQRRVLFPEWGLMQSFAAAIRRAPLSPVESLRCYGELGAAAVRSRWTLLGDLVDGIRPFPVVGRAVARVYDRCNEILWAQRHRLLTRDARSAVPEARRLILVDDGSFGADPIPGRRTLAFIEREGQYWGPPPDDETGIRQLEELVKDGVDFIAFAWPAFWWLDYYRGFAKYLRSRFHCVLENDRLIVFRRKA
jgi:glycosyltransferase involved in cell wall biosynthesis